MSQYDVVIVGSGTAGQTAAYHLNENGLKVAVVENSEHPGGTCALYGCQAKKWFYEATEIIAKSGHLKGKGIARPPEGQWPAILKEKNRFTSRIPEGTVKDLKADGIDFLPGTAKFKDARSLEVDGHRVAAAFFLLATGARPGHLPFEGSRHLITSKDFLDLRDLPPRIVFVGGGFIAFEFAHFAARIGPNKGNIAILEVAERPLGSFDPEMVGLLVAASREEGIDVRTRVNIESIKKSTKGFSITIESGTSLEADLVVHGAGRAPNIETLNLGAAGIEFTDKGIVVDKGMLTTNDRIFAVGDCAATIQLARVADYEAHVAAKNILARLRQTEPARIDYRAVPALLFTYPQYGMVGKTEKALREEGIDYRKSFGKNLSWPSFTRIGLTHAAYKILVGADNEILGAHILSDNASGLINTLKQAMLYNIPADQLFWQSIMSPYPTRESDLTYMLEPFLS